ncbi:MAG: hypothetical protein C4B58_16440 [Deltaproteobacteria bacterium]|nr:MAG: hypothetical protein C4B58_16440 [Deltaproteobacteria bacterium]
MTLSDGSILKMNAKSAVSVRMRSLRRQVELNEGEVFFAVAVDPDRPFEVRTPNGRI